MNTATAANENATQSITNINGYALCTQWADGIERIRDVELAERLGYDRPRKIRDIIKRQHKAGKLSNLMICPTVGRKSDGVPTKPITVYWLTEAQALKVIAKCETPTADAILDEVIAVFVAWRHGRLGTTLNDAIRLLQERLLHMDAEIAALRAGVISRETLNQLRSDVRHQAALECAARRWPTTRASTADIYRELGVLTGWGGKGQPWKLLPATLTHTAFTVLRGREASIRRELRVLADDRQLPLDIEAEPPVPAKKPRVH